MGWHVVLARSLPYCFIIGTSGRIGCLNVHGKHWVGPKLRGDLPAVFARLFNADLLQVSTAARPSPLPHESVRCEHAVVSRRTHPKATY